MKVCPSCGFQNPDEAVYCMRCGTKLDATPATTTQGLENTRLYLTIAYIFSAVMLFIFIIALLFQIIHIMAAIPAGAFIIVYDSIVAGIYAFMVIFSLLVFQRVKTIHQMVSENRIEEADRLISLEWIVIAIIFNGVISGIFLLLSKIEMDGYLGKKTII
ncbi:MAG: zinc ribbon domain-containing protein [Thermoplasmata archaeon]